MRINIFPVVSSLHEQGYISKETETLLKELSKELNAEIKITNLDELYDSDFQMILIQSGGSEESFLKSLPNLRAPYYLLTYGTNNSLAASLEILSYLKDNKLPAEVLHGSASYISSRIKELSNPKLNKTRYGVLGKPSDWLIASQVNYADALKNLNVELVDISLDEVIKLYNEVSLTEYNETYPFEANGLKLDDAKKLYVVLTKIKEKYALDGLTIRCFDLLGTIKTTACLALAIFNAKNTVGTCEGDIPTMMSMHVLNKLFNQPGFQANPSRINIENNTMVLAHCTLPLNMVDSYSLDTHFESRIGVAIRGKLKEEKITIFKFSKDLKNYFVTTGTILRNLCEDNLCRSQIEIKVDENIEYFLTRPYGNHHVIIYGDHKKEIEDFLNNIN